MNTNAQRLRNCSEVIGATGRLDRTRLHLPGRPDEVSLLFATMEELEEFRLWAVKDISMDNFARVEEDLCILSSADWQEPVLTEAIAPIGVIESFGVRFEFLRVPGADWRIEAMCVLGGTAPLHEAWIAKYGSGCVVHVSYKCASRAVYARHCATGPQSSYWGAQPRWRASYANSYGRFSYYEHDAFSFRDISWLLKPRVNERD